MQISGVSLALTWPCRLSLLRVLLCVSCCYKLSPFQAHWGRWHCTRIVRPAYLFTAHMGGGSSPHPVEFPPSATLTSFPTPGCWVHVPTPALSGQAWFVYLQFQKGFPSLSLQSSVRPTLFAMCVYCSYCLLLSFSFFPGWGSVCAGGYADLVQGCLWKYHILISPCGPRLSKLSGCYCLLAALEPSWFVRSTWSGDSLRRLEVWWGQSFACSWKPCLQGVSPASLQDFTLGSTLSASSL
jgi:hypothetical protein